MQNATHGRQALALGASYVMGTFNDNFFKQAGLLLAVSAGNAFFQAQVTFLFALPFVLFSAWSGWLADRFAKKNLVVCAKALELAAMLAGAWGVVTLNWNWLLAMTFCMGLSSTLFSPALNGSIPEIFPPDRVPRVNALFKLGTTASILFGVFLAGVALDQNWIETVRPFGRWLVACIAVGVAAAGLLGTAFIPARPGAGSRNPFPWLGAVHSLLHLREARRDAPLFAVIWAEAFFYFLSTLLLLEINNLGRSELGLSCTVTGMLPVALMVGICTGSLIAAGRSAESWRVLLVPALTGIGVLLCLVPLVPAVPEGFRLPLLLTLYAVTGVCGGLYLIPVTSFVQVRPSAADKGRILGLDNCLVFCGILIAGQLYLPLSALAPSSGHALLGALCLGAALLFRHAVRRLDETDAPSPVLPPEHGCASAPSDISSPAASSITSSGASSGPAPAGPHADPGAGSGSGRPRAGKLALRLLLPVASALLRLRYRTTVEGLDAVRAGNDGRPILFLPNHPALIDPALVWTTLAEFAPRPLGDARQISRPGIRQLASLLDVIPLPDLMRDGRAAEEGVRQALRRTTEALRAGDNVLLYPSGGLTRTGRERLGGNRGAAMLREAVPDARIVLVRTTGLWGSSFSWAAGKAPDSLRGLLLGALLLLLNGIFFMPRRRVRITLAEPGLPPREAGTRAFNRALESFYNEEDPPQALAVPGHFLGGTGPRPLPERPAGATPRGDSHAGDSRARDSRAVDPAIRRAVLDILSAESGVDHIEDETALAGDLGIDSLSLITIGMLLEELSGQPVERLEDLQTAGDCILAAAGLAGGAEEAEPPRAWFPSGEARPLSVPAGRNLVETAFRQILRDPARLMLADGGTALSGRDVLLRTLALASFIRSETPGEERVGIMLPASGAAVLCWLAALVAGRVPVMCNWTTGAANFAHGLNTVGVRRVFTSSRLLDRLERQGFPVREHAAAWIALEAAAAGIGPLAGLGAFLKSRLAGVPGLGRLVMPRRVPETAAILFTSGSESMPRAVPLSHANILANCRDIAAVLSLSTHDRMLAMLPPFHSLGLTGNVALPLAFGLPAVYHANPTEGARLAALPRRWQPTVPVAPPSFLDGMLRKRRPGDLASLRIGFVGAEKCPDAVYAAFAEACDGVLCEGYGVTECAPAISVNRPEHVRPGTIGQPLPSVEIAVVTLEEDGLTDEPKGSTPKGISPDEDAPGQNASEQDEPEQGARKDESPKTGLQPALRTPSAAALRSGSVPERETAGQAKAEDRATPRRVAPGETGMLLVSGPNVFAGYLGTDAQPFVEFEGRRWYRTGDLVSEDPDGCLTFRGRLKRFVKIGGEMISLPQIENVLAQAFGHRGRSGAASHAVQGATTGAGDACTGDSGTGERGTEDGAAPRSRDARFAGAGDVREESGPALAVESGENGRIVLFTTLDVTREEANAALRAARLSGLSSVAGVRRLDALPVLGSGKIDYRKLRALCADERNMA